MVSWQGSWTCLKTDFFHYRIIFQLVWQGTTHTHCYCMQNKLSCSHDWTHKEILFLPNEDDVPSLLCSWCCTHRRHLTLWLTGTQGSQGVRWNIYSSFRVEVAVLQPHSLLLSSNKQTLIQCWQQGRWRMLFLTQEGCSPLQQILQSLSDKNFLPSNLQGLLGNLNASHYVSGNCNVIEWFKDSLG